MEAWEKDKVTFKFVNLEERGGRHVLSVNGRLFQLEDGKTYTVPRAVMSALNDAVYTKYKIEGDKDDPNSQVKYDEPRFFTGEVATTAAAEKMTPKKAAVAAAAADFQEKSSRQRAAQADADEDE